MKDRLSLGRLLILVGLTLFPLNSTFALMAPKDEDLGKEYIGIFYYKYIFGNIHQTPSSYSLGLTTISCGHPLKVFGLKDKNKDGWFYVKVGGHEGYLKADFVNNKKPDCFQLKYPKFFQKMNLDISELYYWGKLYDQFIMGKTRIR